MPQQPSVIGLVPARGGSKRVPRKNIKVLGQHPLIAYTIAAAREAGIFAAVMVSTDDRLTADVAEHYGAEAPFLRPSEMAGEDAPDIEWVDFTLRSLAESGRSFDAFSILRPTSPFRRADTIRRAWSAFEPRREVDSIRAVEKCGQHPGKMWVLEGDLMRPLLDGAPPERPWHSTPYQALPPVYVQNASLEIAWTRVVFETRTIAGNRIMPFLTEGTEGFDINEPHDWWHAEYLVSHGEATLPGVRQSPFPLQT